MTKSSLLFTFVYSLSIHAVSGNAWGLDLNDPPNRCAAYRKMESNNSCPPVPYECTAANLGTAGVPESEQHDVLPPHAKHYAKLYEEYTNPWPSADDVTQSFSKLFEGELISPAAFKQIRLKPRIDACPRAIDINGRRIVTQPRSRQQAPAQAIKAASVKVKSTQSTTNRLLQGIIDVVAAYLNQDNAALTKFAEANHAAYDTYGNVYPEKVVRSLNKRYDHFRNSQSIRLDRLEIRWAAFLAYLGITSGNSISADFDNDSLKDYALVTMTDKPRIRIFMARKSGSGKTIAPTAEYEFSYVPTLGVLHLDSDRLLDIEVRDIKGNWPTSHLLNNGNGTFRLQRPEGFPRVAFRATSSTACVTKLSTNESVCADVGEGATRMDSASFGYMRQGADDFYPVQFVGTKFNTVDQVRVRVTGRPLPSIDENRMGAQATFSDASGQLYLESCSQAGTVKLVCNYSTSDGGSRWEGRCYCTFGE